MGKLVSTVTAWFSRYEKVNEERIGARKLIRSNLESPNLVQI